LTTRDTADPDALYVLRHSAAHLLAEAVRRLYPGTKIAIGPPIENGFYYDFEFPEPIGEDALERIEEEIQRELKEGRAWERQEVSADEAKQLFAEQDEDYKVELVDLASEGDGHLERTGGSPPAREREARLRRGEDAAHLRADALGDLGALGEVPREHVPDPARRRAGVRDQAHELPRAHAALRQ